MPKVSVIIPVYNVENYLRECLDSVLAQTLSDIEVICVNDGSTDGSGAILDEYALKDARINVINQENIGVAASRNKAIKLAQCEFITFIDSDDLLSNPSALEMLYNNAKENHVLVAGGEFGQFEDGIVPRVYDSMCKEGEFGYSYEQGGVVKYCDWQFDYGFHRFIYNREFLLENSLEFPLSIYFEDPVFFVRTMFLAEKFYALKEITYDYRTKHSKSAWNESKTIAVLNGIESNVRFANKHKLLKLRKLTVQRLNEFSTFLRKYIKHYPQIFRIYLNGAALDKFAYYYCIEPVLQNIFSIRNDYSSGHKLKYLTLLGIKFKLKMGEG